ncbi:hypothetical protein [Tautonia sociabilis]|uniref:Uncharacterized protein n=1 Tax=Tautonia sociabilis TaxID=2080755 RepID=A0A432MD16_9BACT|nr:hypothetical protein [Tautonia sociabilis]RUL82547.1 hypothetical protein TsocGM_23430 [Tautonia sociabilis]
MTAFLSGPGRCIAALAMAAAALALTAETIRIRRHEERLRTQERALAERRQVLEEMERVALQIKQNQDQRERNLGEIAALLEELKREQGQRPRILHASPTADPSVPDEAAPDVVLDVRFTLQRIPMGGRTRTRRGLSTGTDAPRISLPMSGLAHSVECNSSEE